MEVMTRTTFLGIVSTSHPVAEAATQDRRVYG